MTTTTRPFNWTPRRIRLLRERLGFSQALFAERLGVHIATVSKWENGWAKPSAPVQIQLDYMSQEATKSPKQTKEAE